MAYVVDDRAWRRLTRSRNRERGLLRRSRRLVMIPDMEREAYAWEIKSTEWYCWVESYVRAGGGYSLVSREKVVLNVVQGAIGSYDWEAYRQVKRRENAFDPDSPVLVSEPQRTIETDYDRPTRWRSWPLPDKRFANDIDVKEG